MITFVFDPEPLEQFKREALTGGFSITGSLQNLTWLWPMNNGGDTVNSILQRNFQRIWSEGQGVWQRPTDAYLAHKRKMGFSPLTMVKRRRLYDSLSAPGGTADTVSYGDAKNFYYGLNVENFDRRGGWSYPEMHDFVGDRRGVTRPFFYLRQDARNSLNTWFGLGMRDRMKQIQMRLRTARRQLRRRAA